MRGLRRNRGATALTYGLVVGLVAIAGLSAVTRMGDAIGTNFTNVSSTLTDAAERGGGSVLTLPTPTPIPEIIGASCADGLSRYPSLQDRDGLYMVDMTGGDDSDAEQVWCDMTTDGGGWTYLWAAPSTGLSDPSLGASISYAGTGSSGCLSTRVISNTESDFQYFYAYNCAAARAQLTFTWSNPIAATEVRFAAVAGGNNRLLRLNGADIQQVSSGKTYFYNANSYSCSTNNCWRNTITSQEPRSAAFSGPLTIFTRGDGDNNLWGGSGGIWLVSVR